MVSERSAQLQQPKETAAADTTAATARTHSADSRKRNHGRGGDHQASAELKEIVVGIEARRRMRKSQCSEREVLASKGYEMKIVEYDYVQPNNAGSGDLDANYFQHKPYLIPLMRRTEQSWSSAGAIHYEPFGIYAGKTASLEELPDKATVLVPNDVSNEARALLLLEAQGLIIAERRRWSGGY